MVNKNLYDDGLIVAYDDGSASLERLPPDYVYDLTDKIHTVRQDEKLTDIAHFYYKKSRLWFIIADANKILDIFNLEVGTDLIIPNENKLQ